MCNLSAAPPRLAPSGANAAEEVVDMAAAAEDGGGGRKAAAAGGGGDGSRSGVGALWRRAGGKVLSIGTLSSDEEEEDGGVLQESKTAVISETHSKRFWAMGARKLYRAVCVARSSSPGKTPKPGYLASTAAPEEALTIKSKRRPPHCASVGHSIFSNNRSSRAPFSCRGMMPQAEGMEDW
jgi:hypothetical protein